MITVILVIDFVSLLFTFSFYVPNISAGVSSYSYKNPLFFSRQTASGMSLQDDDDNMTLSDGDSVSGMDRVAKGMSPLGSSNQDFMKGIIKHPSPLN